MVTRLRATGMPIRAIREYAELVREGDGNEEQRLALLEAHREHVLEQLAKIERNLELVDYKIGLYRERRPPRRSRRPLGRSARRPIRMCDCCDIDRAATPIASTGGAASSTGTTSSVSISTIHGQRG